MYCRVKYSELICRSVAAQFMPNDLIAMFELTLEDEDIKIVDEKHYKLVPASNISKDDLVIKNIQVQKGVEIQQHVASKPLIRL